MSIDAPDVFVSVGSMMPFDRLVKAMDEWAGSNQDVSVQIQIGRGKYKPRHAHFVQLLPANEYRQRVAKAKLFVAHAGMGSILAAIEAGKPFVMLPRLQEQGEHNTDHQVATAASIGARQGLHVAADVEDLKARASALLANSGLLPKPISRYADPGFISRIAAFIHGQRP